METPSTALIFPNPALPALTIEQVVARRNVMVEFVQRAMVRDTDYGTIPGAERKDANGKTISKDTLLKPGAEKLCTLFGLSTRFTLQDKVEDWTGDEHGGEPLFYFRFKCQLYRGDVFMGEGEGACSSWEKKYRYRNAQRVCPNCGKATIFKSKNPGEGFYCWTKKEGCGAKFAENAPAILEQDAGQIKNPEIADVANTVLKMAQKRSHIAATLTTVNASEFFTQDLEDMLIKVVEVDTEPNAGVASTVKAQTIITGTAAKAPAYTRTHPPMSPVQKTKLTELYRLLHPGDDISVDNGLAALFQETFNHPIGEGLYEEGARLTGQLLAELRKQTTYAGPSASAPAPVVKAAPIHDEPPATASGIMLPKELASVLRSVALRAYPNSDRRRAVQGVVAGKLDDYAGDTERRRTFLLAIFDKTSMTELTDGQVMALDAWKDHPRAKEEVNRIIADYLRSKGQQELTLDTEPLFPEPTAGLRNFAPQGQEIPANNVPAEVANFNIGAGVTVPSKKTMPPAVPLCTQAQRNELIRLFAAASEGDVDEGEKVLAFRVKQQFKANTLYELSAVDANILIADMQAQTEQVPF